MTDSCWFIEAPGPHYLAVRPIVGTVDARFYWTKDPSASIAFKDRVTADAVMMAVRKLSPDLFQFAYNLGEAVPVEHGFITGGPAHD